MFCASQSWRRLTHEMRTGARINICPPAYTNQSLILGLFFPVDAARRLYVFAYCPHMSSGCWDSEAGFGMPGPEGGECRLCVPPTCWNVFPTFVWGTGSICKREQKEKNLQFYLNLLNLCVEGEFFCGWDLAFCLLFSLSRSLWFPSLFL